jgi:hypothetical protein
VILLLSLSMGLGLWLGWKFLCRAGSNPIQIGFHLILGVAGLEAVVMLMHGTPGGALSAAGSLGKLAALLLALAVISGFATSVLARRWSRKGAGTVLASHALLGALGWVVFLAWARAG